MALYEFERWLDDKIDFFKQKGTVIFGTEGDKGEESYDSDEYGDFEMAQDQTPTTRRRADNPEEFHLSEPDFEFDDSDLKGSEYYRFVFNELEDDDEDELFDRASHISLPKSGVADDVASYQGDIDQDLEFSDGDDQEVRDSYDAVRLAQQGVDQLEAFEYRDNPGRSSHYRDVDYRLEGDGESNAGSLTDIALRERQQKHNEGADFGLAQLSDENGGHSKYHRKKMKHSSLEMSSQVATLPMDSTYLSMDDTDDDDQMLEDVRFDDYEGTEIPPDTRPIMVEEQTLREMYDKRRKLFKKLLIGFGIIFALVLVCVVIYLIWRLAGNR